MTGHAYAYTTGNENYTYEIPLTSPGNAATVDIAVIWAEGKSQILTVFLNRDEDGNLAYEVQEHADDDAPTLGNVLPDFFPVA